MIRGVELARLGTVLRSNIFFFSFIQKSPVQFPYLRQKYLMLLPLNVPLLILIQRHQLRLQKKKIKKRKFIRIWITVRISSHAMLKYFENSLRLVITIANTIDTEDSSNCSYLINSRPRWDGTRPLSESDEQSCQYLSVLRAVGCRSFLSACDPRVIVQR